MKAITSPCPPRRLDRDTVEPSVSFNSKSGAGVPRDSIVEEVAAMDCPFYLGLLFIYLDLLLIVTIDTIPKLFNEPYPP
jgi:hypothetical protein